MSLKWRPWDRAQASDSEKTYRDSAKELYADFVSVLLNNPGLAEADAPVFTKQFLTELDNKPEVKKAFFDIWELLSGTPEELQERRQKNLDRMFAEGNTRSVDLLGLKRKERALDFTDLLFHHTRRVLRDVYWYARRGLENKNEPVMRRLREDEQAQRAAKIAGASTRMQALRAWLAPRAQTIAPEANPFFALSELSYRIAGRVKAWLQEWVQTVHQSVVSRGMTWVEFGQVLMLERIIAGDRGDFANALGYSPASADQKLDHLQQRWSEVQRTVMRRAVDKFRMAVKRVAREAYEAGLYTEETWEKIKTNPAYATFHAIEHLEDALTARISEQIGSVKDIRNPADATIDKTIATIRAIEHQRARRLMFEYLERRERGDIKDADVEHLTRVVDGALVHFTRPKDPPVKDRGKWALVRYYEHGKVVGKYVDPWVAAMLHRDNSLNEVMAIRVAAGINDSFKQIVTTYNPGYQPYNLLKDAGRFFKAMSQKTRRGDRYRRFGITPWRAIKRYQQAARFATVRTYGLASPASTPLRKGYRTIMGHTVDPTLGALDVLRGKRQRERRTAASPTAAETQYWADLLQAEKAGIISTNFSDRFEHAIESDMVQNIMAAHGVARRTKRRGLVRAALQRDLAKKDFREAVVALRDVLRNTSNFIETLPRAAGMYEFKGEGEISDIPADQRQFIRANIGSPDFLAGGTAKPITNNVFIFSNAIVQSVSADLETAFINPATRMGYLTKTVLTSVVPKLLVAAAIAAAAGVDGGDDDDEDQPWMKEMRRRLAAIPWLVDAGRVLRKVPSYVLTNYIVVPLGLDKDGNAVVARLPPDETGKQLGGVHQSWLAEDRTVWQAIVDTVDYTSSQLPSLTPLAKVPLDLLAYASGQNVEDTYRRRDVLTKTEQDAREADTWAWEPLKKFTGYEFQQMGLGLVWKLYVGEDRPTTQKTLWQAILDFELPTPQATLDFGGSSNILGRFVMITRGGEVERNRAPGTRARANRAQRTLSETQAVNEAVRAYQARPAGEQTRGLQERVARDLADQLYPEARGDERADHEKRVIARMTLSSRRAEGDPLVVPLLSAQSNEEKVAIIVGARPNYTPEQFEQWLRTAHQQKIVSDLVLRGVREKMANAYRQRQLETVH